MNTLITYKRCGHTCETVIAEGASQEYLDYIATETLCKDCVTTKLAEPPIIRSAINILKNVKFFNKKIYSNNTVYFDGKKVVLTDAEMIELKKWMGTHVGQYYKASTSEPQTFNNPNLTNSQRARIYGDLMNEGYDGFNPYCNQEF